MPDIRFVIFDMDKVLYDYEHPVRLALLEELTGRPAADIDRDVWGGPHENAAEAGEPETAEAYLAQFARLLKHPIDFDTFADVRRRMMRPRQDVLATVRRLKPRADLALLTNNGMLLKAALPVCAPEVIEIFGEKAHVSAEFKARKPDRDVYLKICGRYGYSPDAALFVDDRLENTDGAAAAGLHVHHYQNHDGLLRCLKEHGFNV
ncbi:HAD family phosphatase [Roseibium denhamense]|nr:HAD family phosphatase [Roseibium denhamense]